MDCVDFVWVIWGQGVIGVGEKVYEARGIFNAGTAHNRPGSSARVRETNFPRLSANSSDLLFRLFTEYESLGRA